MNENIGNMKKIASIIFIIVIMFSSFINFVNAANVSELINQTVEGEGGISGSSNLYSTGLFKDWQILSVLCALISLFIVAIAHMVAQPFNLPDLKAWANLEWGQVFVTVIIVGCTITALEFVDIIIMEQVNNSPASPVKCSASDFCLFNVSNTYLDGLIELTNSSMRNTFIESVKAGKASISRVMLSCTTFLYPPCLWGYTGWANNAFLSLDVDRYTQEIEQYNSVLYSLTIQKFFVSNVNYNVGPALLLIGIVARSFFITRKAGGLLMATAIGIMFVFPMMYLWNMITLNVAVFGDDLFQGLNSDCPEACTYTPPVAYKDGNALTYGDFYVLIGMNDSLAEEFKKGTIESYNDVYSCEFSALETNTTEGIYCPRLCRELPYPYVFQDCSDPRAELACTRLPIACKLIRNITTCPPDELRNCSDECRVIPPLNGGRDCETCFINASNKTPNAIPFSCRIALRTNIADVNDTSGRPSQCVLDSSPYKQATLNCKASLDPYQSCMYIMPDFPDDRCQGCLNVTNDYCLFKPPIVNDCGSECTEESILKPTLLNPAEFAKKSGDGMFGREDIKNVSRLVFPAYFLPLINIIVTLMFIRGFSPIFGGDIDIPGYLKVL
ncbi:MAG: hypothetical protein AB1391_01240 [Candidatus Micrarchaeota archaeon]